MGAAARGCHQPASEGAQQLTNMQPRRPAGAMHACAPRRDGGLPASPPAGRPACLPVLAVTVHRLCMCVCVFGCVYVCICVSVHACVWGRGAGLGSGRFVGRGSSGAVRGRELVLGFTCGSGWVTVTEYGLTPVTRPAVPIHTDNDKRMLRARPGLHVGHRRSGVKIKKRLCCP